MSFRFACLLLLPLLISTSFGDEIDFNRDIRPILSNRCFACHGPDEEHREAGFRLDQKESAFGEADSGEHPLVAGKLQQSELWRRITSTDNDLRMPPADSNKPLKPEQIELIRQWIEQGAKYSGHWSLTPPKRPPLPKVSQSDWPREDIDRFILARLEKEKLTPSPEADKIALLRRVTLDLTGLPPTLAEVDAFLADDSEGAYEKVVDRLLKSSRFGEHFARYWLDAARYGDTHGLHLDNYREMWPYRDWVIQSYNDNKPFNDFLVEQLAGDLLSNATTDQQVATGFLRCNVTTGEGGSIAEEVYVRNVNDRVTTFATVYMGATFECTRCHDHKFDPYTQKDYYSLFAYFNSINGAPLDGNKKDHAPVVRVASADQKKQQSEFDRKLASLNQRLVAPWPAVDAAQQLWAAKLREEQPAAKNADWRVIEPTRFTSQGKAELKKLDDHSILASGPNPAKEVYEIIGELPVAGVQTIQLEGLIDKSLTAGGAGRSSNSNVVLTEFEAYTATADKRDDWKQIEFTAAWADHEQTDGDFKIGNAIDGKPQTGWAIQGHVKRENRTARFLASTPLGKQGSLLKVVLKHESVHTQHTFGRVRLAVSAANTLPHSIPANIIKLVNKQVSDRSDAEQNELQKYYRDLVSSDAELAKVRAEIKTLQKQRDQLSQNTPTTLVFKETPKPKDAFLLFRGEYDQKREKVTRRTPTSLPLLGEEPPKDRLELAKWLVHPDHPFTARVAVNRIWQQLFGTGIVKTSEDFGSQGEPPSHPELLDFLAIEFMESGWNTKQLIKQLVMSATYRQTARVTPELLQRDQSNRLLARGPRYRLAAEAIRDQALAVSGLLREHVGGPPVKPPQPNGLWYAVAYSGSNTAKFVADKDPAKTHRRTIYTFLKRTAVAPQISTFDGPSRESSCVRRERTNTPLQALLLFNDVQFIEAARALAARAFHEGGGSAKSRAAYMFRLATCRRPTENELADLVAGFQEDLAVFEKDQESAKKLLNFANTGELPPETAELAAWTMTANMILNLDEVLNK